MNRAPFSLQDTWAHVAELYGWIVSLFGAAAEIAEKRVLLRQNRRDILAWLGPVEALARRLLLLKALALPKPNQPAPPPAAQAPLAVAFTDAPAWAPEDRAEDWRVVFRVLPRGALRRPGRPAAAFGDRRGEAAMTAYPLARRLEALRRVLENPEPALKRLARFLAQNQAGGGGAAVLAFAPYRPAAPCCRQALDETQDALEAALNTS